MFSKEVIKRYILKVIFCKNKIMFENFNMILVFSAHQIVHPNSHIYIFFMRYLRFSFSFSVFSKNNNKIIKKTKFYFFFLNFEIYLVFGLPRCKADIERQTGA